jgi:hypothetical protein
MKIKWERMPSVTYGGKPYFWYGGNWKRSYHIVWNRNLLGWELKINHITLTILQTDKDAKRIMQLLVDKKEV